MISETVTSALVNLVIMLREVLNLSRLRVRILVLKWTGGLWICILFVMQNYLTDVWRLSFTHAAAILNIWGGISRMLPVFILFISETALGNFMVLVLSSSAFTVGMAMLTLSTPPVLANLTRTCKQYEPQCIGDPQKALFYTAMTFIAVAAAAQRASLKSFFQEQNAASADAGMVILDIRKSIVICIINLMPAIGIFSFPYIKNWSLLFGMSTIGIAIATLVFLSGCCVYARPEPEGSIVSSVFRVFVAVAFKISKPYPTNDQIDYRQGDFRIKPTHFLRFMEKAAIIYPGDDQEKIRWRLCTLYEVECAKVIVCMIPMWATFITCGIISSVGNTYFVEQGSHMNRKLGRWRVPSQVLLTIFYLGKKIFRSLAKSLVDKFEEYGPRIGIAVSMIFSVLCCIAAAGVETWRLKDVRSHGLVNKPDEDIPMSAYWLFFQFFLLAGLESFFEKSTGSLFMHQVPESLENFMSIIHNAIIGVGFMFGVLSIHVVGEVSKEKYEVSWIQDTLNASRLNRYYWVLAAWSSVNLLVYVIVASFYGDSIWKADPLEHQLDA